MAVNSNKVLFFFGIIVETESVKLRSLECKLIWTLSELTTKLLSFKQPNTIFERKKLIFLKTHYQVFVIKYELSYIASKEREKVWKSEIQKSADHKKMIYRRQCAFTNQSQYLLECQIVLFSNGSITHYPFKKIK